MESHTIQFQVEGIPYEFEVKHDLKEHGLHIGDAVHSWLFRTDVFTKESFIAYLKRKTPTAKIK